MTLVNTKTSAWWTADVHADRRPFLMARNAIQTSLRGYFATRDFLEVDTSILQVSPGNEAHLHAFSTEAVSIDGQSRPFYLHTSPEFAMKKLLAAGETRIFTFAHAFRNREHGPMHHPEFTMLEWYRTGESYERLMEDCAAILARASEKAKANKFNWRGVACDPFLSPERLSVAEAFDRYVGIDLLATLSPEGLTDREGFADEARAAGIRVAEDDSWSDIFSRVLVERIEPNLGHGRPTILDQYPVSEAALARRSPQDHRVAERFELYVCGVELANGFGELTDASEQRARFEEEMRIKRRVYGESYPIDEDFLNAVSVMPESAGIALGFERLVMLAAGASRIDQVIWAPVAMPPVEARSVDRIEPQPILQRPAAPAVTPKASAPAIASGAADTQPAATADFVALISAAVAGVSMSGDLAQQPDETAQDDDASTGEDDALAQSLLAEADEEVDVSVSEDGEAFVFDALSDMTALSEAEAEGEVDETDEHRGTMMDISDLEPEDVIQPDMDPPVADEAEMLDAADQAEDQPGEEEIDADVDLSDAMEAEILAALVLEPEFAEEKSEETEQTEATKAEDASEDHDKDPFEDWDGLDLLELKEAKG
jgi:elongation factor P--(R)-beta-lysine ligase